MATSLHMSRQPLHAIGSTLNDADLPVTVLDAIGQSPTTTRVTGSRGSFPDTPVPSSVHFSPADSSHRVPTVSSVVGGHPSSLGATLLNAAHRARRDDQADASPQNPLSLSMANSAQESASPLDQTTNISESEFRDDDSDDDENVLQVSSVNKHKLLVQTMVFASVPTIARYLITEYTGWNGYMDLRELALVFTGLFFTSGILFSNVNADLKEAERMPADVASSLEQIEDQFVYMSKKCAEPDMRPVHRLILKFIILWKQTLRDVAHLQECLETLAEFPRVASVWDKNGGGGAGTINGAVDRIRRIVARAGVISRTDVLPSAHGLLQFFVFASTIILFLTAYNVWVTQVCIMLCVYTVTWFNVRLISFIDDPFEEEIPFGMSFLLGTIRQVHLFPLDEYAIRVLKRQGKFKLLKRRRSTLQAVARRAVDKKKSVDDDDIVMMAFNVQND